MTRALAVMLPVHKREKVAQIACKCLERVLSELKEHGIDSRVLVVGNEKWAEDMAQSKGWKYLRQNNASVGSKFDAGARYIVDKWGEWGTHFMEFCSDNIVSTHFTELVKDSILQNKDHSVTTNAFYIMNDETKEVRLFHVGVGTNVGRVTKMGVLRAMRNRGDGKLFCHGIKRGLDRSFRVRMQKVTGRRPRLHDIAVPYIIDVKDRDSMHGWHRFASKPEQFPLVEIEGIFPELPQLLNPWPPQEKSGPTPSTSTSAASSATPSTPTQAVRPVSASSKSSPQSPAPSRCWR